MPSRRKRNIKKKQILTKVSKRLSPRKNKKNSDPVYHTDRCSNPFGLEGHKGKQLRFVPPEYFQKFPHLKPGSRYCNKCRMHNNKGITSSEAQPANIHSEPELIPNETEFDSPVHVPMQSNDEFHEVIDDPPLNTTADQCTIATKSQREQDLEEIFDNLKSKFLSLDERDPLRIRILTVLPASWSERKIADEFNTSRHSVKKARKLKQKSGIMGDVCAKRGKSISEETVEKIKQFYNSDDNSRVLPSVKQTVTMRVDGKNIKVQKRLLLLSLNELYALFTQQNPKNTVSFSLFATLRPKNCILPGKSGTHSVCVCTHHQNVILMLQGINLSELTNQKLVDYHDCVKMIVCEKPTNKCYLGHCKDCPGITNFYNYLIELFDEYSILEVKYSFWTGTDRATLETTVKSSEEYVEELCDKLEKLKMHSFIAKKQSEFIKSQKENLSEGEVLVTFDFAENYAYAVQNASQAFHFNNDQCTVFTCIFYYKSESIILQKSCIFLSDSNKHNTSAVYAIQSQLLPFIKKNVSKLKRVIYVSDGAKQHFKNRFQMANLKNHKKDFGVAAEWHFSATAHGKCACDGLGACFKREAYRASLKAKPSDAILNLKSLFSWAKTYFDEVNIFNYSKAEHDRCQRHLNQRFNTAEEVLGIMSNHCFKVSSNGSLVMEIFSTFNSKIYRV